VAEMLTTGEETLHRPTDADYAGEGYVKETPSAASLA
jgi:hypothetical protein